MPIASIAQATSLHARDRARVRNAYFPDWEYRELVIGDFSSVSFGRRRALQFQLTKRKRGVALSHLTFICRMSARFIAVVRRDGASRSTRCAMANGGFQEVHPAQIGPRPVRQTCESRAPKRTFALTIHRLPHGFQSALSTSSFESCPWQCAESRRQK